MPAERLSAIDQHGITHQVIRRTPYFPAVSRTSSRFDMATFRLDTGEDLSPTGEPDTFRTADGTLIVTLVRRA